MLKQNLEWRCRALQRQAFRLSRRMTRTLVRLDAVDIRATLQHIGDLRSDILLVHSSLSACGHVVGGARTVVEALREWSRGRMLVMPAHSYCYPGEPGYPSVFHPDRSPSRVGAITEYFRKQNGVIRSTHPTHSLAAEGPGSREILSGHDRCRTPCGAGTPYERLIQANASVLMFGAPMSTYTLFHTAEDAAGVPYLYYPEKIQLRIVEDSGMLRSMPMWRQDNRVPRRFDEAGQMMQALGLASSRRLGRGTLRFIPSSLAVHDWLLETLGRDPLFLTESGTPGRAKGRSSG